jgi:hypothetical protein
MCAPRCPASRTRRSRRCRSSNHPSDRQILGYLTEQYALRRYNQALERRRAADLGERDLFSIAEPPR